MYTIINRKGTVVSQTDDLFLASLITEALELTKQEKHKVIEVGSLSRFKKGPVVPQKIWARPTSHP